MFLYFQIYKYSMKKIFSYCIKKYKKSIKKDLPAKKPELLLKD